MGHLTADELTLSHARARLAAHPVVVDIVRAAAHLAKAMAECVVFESGRSFVVASAQYDVLQPRAQFDAERRLIQAGRGHVAGTDCSVFAVHAADGVLVGALVVRADVAPDGYHALARAVSAVLAEGSTQPAGWEASVLHGLRDAVVVVDPTLQITWTNRAVGSLLGRTAAELVGRSAVDLIHPDDVESAFEAIIRLSEGLETYRAFVRLRHGDGSFSRIEVTGTDRTADPDVGGLVLSLRNAEAESEVELQLDRTVRMAAAIVSELHDGIVATDAFGAITLVNTAAKELFGFDRDAPVGSFRLDELALLDADGRPVTDVEHTLGQLTDAHQPAELCVVSASRGLRYVSVTRRGVRQADGTVLGSVLVFHDQTDARRSAEELKNHALHDQLTGLANRRQLTERVVALSTSGREGLVAACFVDLDGFKLVNDTHGHTTGDVLIRIAAKRLQGQLRPNDLLVRHGGDEFIALLGDIEDMDGAVQVAERLREALARPYRVDTVRFDLTASLGVATMEIVGLDEDQLLRQADIALYAAKARGRNRVEAFTDALAVATEVEERQRRMLRDALDNDRLVMHFQPLVDTTTGKTIGYEALARCRAEDGTLVGPSAFLDSISSSGLVWDLDRRAFELSCQAAAVLADLQGANSPVIACNFSALSLGQPNLVEFVVGTVERIGVEPGRICIEITESAAFDAGATGLASLSALYEAGFRLALDDFGTGYSSLAHLRDLPLSTVKVDRTFVSKLSERSSERAIAEAIVALAGDLGLGVVAEGVESLEQLVAAQDLGFTVIQGWHFSPAMALDQVLGDWLTRPDQDLPERS